MKDIKFFALLAMIWGTAGFTSVASIRPMFREKPYLALIIFFAGSVVYRIIDEFEKR